MNLAEIMIYALPLGWGMGILLSTWMFPELKNMFPIMLFYIFGGLYVFIGILIAIFKSIKIWRA